MTLLLYLLVLLSELFPLSLGNLLFPPTDFQHLPSADGCCGLLLLDAPDVDFSIFNKWLFIYAYGRLLSYHHSVKPLPSIVDQWLCTFR